jgi:RNA polymerase sigma-70 factor (ECF subfamily)
VQEAWLRVDRAGTDGIENLGAWLTTVVARIALDMLRARRARPEDAIGMRLPEPVVTVEAASDPEEQALMADSVGLALLVVLDTLTPAERLAFVLHDMFGLPFEDIAPIVERSPAAARQLASRARRRVRGAAPRTDPDLARQREVVRAFLAASQVGDFEGLVAVLAPDVVFRIDGGGLPSRSGPPVVGAGAVARRVLERGSRLARFARPATVNGSAGAIVIAGTTPVAVVAFTVTGGRIATIDLMADPEKLARYARLA